MRGEQRPKTRSTSREDKILNLILAVGSSFLFAAFEIAGFPKEAPCYNCLAVVSIATIVRGKCSKWFCNISNLDEEVIILKNFSLSSNSASPYYQTLETRKEGVVSASLCICFRTHDPSNYKFPFHTLASKCLKIAKSMFPLNISPKLHV